MIKSMTGYGKSNININSREYQIEIKTVNHKYNDITIKIPKIISYIEDDIRKKINEKIKRGKIDISITFEDYSEETTDIKINTELARVYIQNLKKLAEEERISSNIEVTEIAKYPDILKIKSNFNETEVKKEIMLILESVIDQVVEMRENEGKQIAGDIEKKISEIDSKIQEIFQESTGLIQEYVVKLETRVREILKTEEIDKSRLMQEVVIYADKCSIEEEITRMKSHINQLKNILQKSEPAGKKMDFIVQEMNRETNTIGAKANKLEITNKVIDIKTILEDIREQIQNIE